MWILSATTVAKGREANTPSISKFHLLPSEKCTVGRKSECDLVPMDNVGVSRKHGEFEVGGEPLALSYLDTSKVGSTLLRAGERVSVTSNKKIALKHGDTVTIGTKSEIRVHHDPVIVCSSGLNVATQKRLMKLCEQTGIQLDHEWSDNITHLVVDSSKTRLKVLQAQVACLPIISLSWFEAILNRERLGPLPPIEGHVIADVLLPNPRRKHVFSDFALLSFRDDLKKPFEELARSSGADLWAVSSADELVTVLPSIKSSGKPYCAFMIWDQSYVPNEVDKAIQELGIPKMQSSMFYGSIQHPHKVTPEKYPNPASLRLPKRVSAKNHDSSSEEDDLNVVDSFSSPRGQDTRPKPAEEDLSGRKRMAEPYRAPCNSIVEHDAGNPVPVTADGQLKVDKAAHEISPRNSSTNPTEIICTEYSGRKRRYVDSEGSVSHTFGVGVFS
eukprot:Rmarinus@m.14025